MKKESMFIIGIFLLSLSYILGTILIDLPLINFLEGVFTGISLVMNIGFLIRYRLEKNYDEKHNRVKEL